MWRWAGSFPLSWKWWREETTNSVLVHTGAFPLLNEYGRLVLWPWTSPRLKENQGEEEDLTRAFFFKVYIVGMHVQSCLTLCDPMDHSPPDPSVHGILQARILERAAISSSRESFRPRDWTCVSCIDRQILYHWATWKCLILYYYHLKNYFRQEVWFHLIQFPSLWALNEKQGPHCVQVAETASLPNIKVIVSCSNSQQKWILGSVLQS